MNEPKARQPRRRSMRHPTFGYAEPGSYFVTICVEGRRRALGEVTDGEMFPSPAGRLAESCLMNLEARFPTTLVDCFVVMPNHVHTVIVLGAREPTAPEEGAMNRAATRSLVGRSRPKLGELVRVFKAMSTRLVRTNVMPEFA